MKRNDITAHVMPLASRKWKGIASKINAGDLSILGELDEYSNIVTMKYIEDGTQEIRNVNVIQIGLPVQMCIYFHV